MFNEKLLQGNLELILLSILEEGEMYGLEIITEANAHTKGFFDFKEGSLYPALHRMTRTGWLEAEHQPSDKGGPRRRYYRLTDAGRRVLERKRQEWSAFNRAVQALQNR
ncbi:MAG: PadR family transcriptional regulator [Meiothermus sp.]